MQIFFGTYFYHLDEKSRLILPQKMRDIIGSRCYVTKGFDNCLCLYPEETFIELSEKNARLNELVPEERTYKRTFFASSMDYEFDKVGRITLSKDHLARANITKDVVVVGNYDHVEIWDKDIYSQVSANDDASFEANAQAIAQKEDKNV